MGRRRGSRKSRGEHQPYDAQSAQKVHEERLKKKQAEEERRRMLAEHEERMQKKTEYAKRHAHRTEVKKKRKKTNRSSKRCNLVPGLVTGPGALKRVVIGNKVFWLTKDESEKMNARLADGV